MSNHTETLSRLHDHHNPPIPAGGHPTRLWVADVTVVNPDGTVDCQPVTSRASKVAVPTLAGYTPTVGDRVLLGEINGDPRIPVVLGVVQDTPPTVTGSRGGNAALTSLLSALDGRGLIIDQTT